MERMELLFLLFFRFNFSGETPYHKGCLEQITKKMCG